MTPEQDRENETTIEGTAAIRDRWGHVWPEKAVASLAADQASLGNAVHNLEQIEVLVVLARQADEDDLRATFGLLDVGRWRTAGALVMRSRP